MGLISTVLWFAIPALVLITVVVFIHELGHFLVARWCGVKVQTFSIGFGKEIAGFTDKHGTRWCFARWPLGGYVRFMDDENAASVPSKEALQGLSDEQRAGAFQTKPLWQRSAVVLAGPVFNIVSAALILMLSAFILGARDTPSVIEEVEAGSPAAQAGLRSGDRLTGLNGSAIAWISDVNRVVAQSAGVPLKLEFERDGRRTTVDVTPAARPIKDPVGNNAAIGDIGLRGDPPATIGEVQVGSPAAAAGLQAGDRITAIGGQPTSRFSDLQRIVSRSPAKPLDFSIDRGGQPLVLAITPRLDKRTDDAGKVVERGLIGVGPERGGVQRRYGPVEAVGHGLSETANFCWQVIKGLPRIPAAIANVFRFKPQSDIGGPGAIVEMTSHAAKSGVQSFIGWIAVFSVILGIMNLLPIPLLDGGHLVFYALEAIRGRPLDERLQEWAFKIGIVMIATLMSAAFIGDATRYVWRYLGAG